MIIVVTGSRQHKDADMIRGALEEYRNQDHVHLYHGGAAGADSLAAECAAELGFLVTEVPAQWDHHGKQAGPIRNGVMLGLALAEQHVHDTNCVLLAFPLPGSIGTHDCVRQAQRKGLSVIIHQVGQEPIHQEEDVALW